MPQTLRKCEAGGRVEDCDGKEMGAARLGEFAAEDTLARHEPQVLFIGSGGEVHKHALEIMGNVEWAPCQKSALGRICLSTPRPRAQVILQAPASRLELQVAEVS